MKEKTIDVIIKCPKCGMKYEFNLGTCPRCGNMIPPELVYGNIQACQYKTKAENTIPKLWKKLKNDVIWLSMTAAAIICIGAIICLFVFRNNFILDSAGSDNEQQMITVSQGDA